MDAFSLNPPKWTANAVHAVPFCCPTCKAQATKATKVWLNRRSPVTDYDLRRKWQEFYLCECETAWWAWSSDRPPSKEGRMNDRVN
ncbi:conserved hypothetical protein [Hyella patelloides LEGE 07179]|uniref:Uncharacterized protein n=1 Tax=Hyella patelloides LEGE 07179 TaxID=945734 RepID=A0A563VXC0_9CYAN|nr:hypothetical protein [Hyella patelloides]VEP16045.1 conserved hypothetical protein [Hyella patelloides LEGE 07179]